MSGEVSRDDIISPFSSPISISFSNPLDETLLDSQGKEIASKITSKSREDEACSILSLIEHLGPQLTSTNVHDRVKAVDILSRVLNFLPRNFLKDKELDFLTDFLINRLKDQHLVVPKALLCCLPIIQCQNLPHGLGARLLEHIFQEVNVQSHVHKIRQNVFQIIEFLIQNKLDEVQELSSDFIINFLQAIDGEKDPRNLLLLFQIIPSIISYFNLGPFIEDFFEVLACYFPIEFSPTVNIGGSIITREMLATSLHHCLSHTNKFSSFLIPLALEKLDSSLQDAKIDSLRLLELCCVKSYQPENLSPFLPQIWHSLRREIFMSGNEIVEKQSIAFLRAAFALFSKEDQALNNCIDLIFTECKHHLCEPEMRLILPTSRILVAMISASEKSCCAAIPRVLIVLNDQLVKTLVQGERKRIMEVTELLIASCREYPEVTLISLLDKTKWDEMIATWFTFLSSEDLSFVLLSLRILSRVMEREQDFTQKERTLLQEHLLALLLNAKGKDEDEDIKAKETFSIIIKITEKLVTHHSQEFSSFSLSKIMEIDSHSSFKVIGETALCNSSVFELVVSSLLSKISSHSIPAFQCLNRIVEKVVQGQTFDKEKASLFSYLMVEKLNVFNHIFPFAVSSQIEDDIAVNIIRNLMRSSSETTQNQLVERYWKQEILQGQEDLNLVLKSVNFPVVESILGTLRPSINFYERDELLQYLIHKSLQEETENVVALCPYQRLLSVLINKSSETAFSTLLPTLENEIRKRLTLVHDEDDKMDVEGEKDGQGCNSDSLPFSEKEELTSNMSELGRSSLAAVSLLSWITKGLAMRGIKDLSNWMEMLISLLHYQDSRGLVASSGFEILLKDDEVSLNPQSHCNFRFLYKQRVFQLSVSMLVKGFKGSKSNIAKANFIRALSCQLKYVSKDVLAMEIENVFPLLVASLKLDFGLGSLPLVSSTLKAFTEMLENSDSQVEKKLIEYIFDVVPELAKLATFQGDMEVRIMALKCLRNCAKCPSHVILPLRDEVIQNLLKSLDDHKRLVRSEARITRNYWILVGSPGGL